MNELLYPISEVFTSVQGEGVYTGVMMTFVRLAGCTVGKPYKISKDAKAAAGLSIYTEECTLYDGRKFPCDTDYRVKSRLTAAEISKQIPDNIDRICITGGEPCMHDLLTLIPKLSSITYNGVRKIHLETSGTIDFNMEPVWVTVSPKKGVLQSMLTRADELKLLVDENFNPEEVIPGTLALPFVIAEQKPTYLHPVNFEKTINPVNVKLCRKWQDKYPQFRVGLQLHKALSLFTEHEVR
jgi:7-carboxy-7-deazaguanine synthase